MRHPFVALFVLAGLCASPARAQWLETTIYLPDSLSGLSSPSHLVYNPTNHLVYVGGANRYVIAVDPATSQKVARIPIQSDVQAFACDAAANKVYCANASSDAVDVIDGATNMVVRTIPVGSYPNDLCFDTSGTLYCTNYGDGTITLIRDDSMSGLIPDAGSGPWSLAFNPASNRVYCTDYDADSIVVIQGGSVIDRVAVDSGPSVITCNSQSNKVYVATDDATIAVIDAALDSVLATIPTDFTPMALGWSSNGNKVYATVPGDTASSIFVIDGLTDSVIQTHLDSRRRRTAGLQPRPGPGLLRRGRGPSGPRD
jgi:YVTN family beta-propeller protein